MPKTWSEKEERQYEHIKQSEKKRGRTTKRAKEIAARTVNKQRRTSGRTSNRRTMGTGNPMSDLEERTKDELMNRAKELGIRGSSRMTKEDLVKSIRAA